MVIDFVVFPVFVMVLCLIGLGFTSSTHLLLNGPKSSSIPVFFLPLFGLFAIGFVSLLINFITGVSSAITYVALLPFIAVGIFNRDKKFIKAFKTTALIAVLTTPLAANMVAGYDGGLYHLPHQKWIRDEAIVVGLANFHGRYGFSSFQEYIDAPLWFGAKFKLLSYVLASFFVSFLVFIYDSIISRHPLPRALAVFIAINLVIYKNYVPWEYTSTDPGAGLVFSICFALGLKLITSRGGSSQADNAALLFVFLMLAVMSVALKTSSIIIAVWVIVVVLQLLRLGWVKPAQLAVILILPVLFLVFWLLRGVLTTGCLLYPLSWSCLDVAWSAKTNAIDDATWVTAWARHPGKSLYSLEGWSWLQNYWLRANSGFILGLGVASAGVFIVGALARRHFRFERNHGKAIFSGMVVIFLGLSLWFLKAPTPRFGIGAFLLAAPIVTVFAFGAPVDGDRKVWRKIGIVLVGLLVLRNDGLGRVTLGRLMQFDPLPVGVTEVEPDADFGVWPKEGFQCWLAEHCVAHKRPSPTKKWGYRIFEPQREAAPDNQK